MGAREAAAAAGYRATLASNAAAQVGRPRRCSACIFTSQSTTAV
jgi:hypothetical protein